MADVSRWLAGARADGGLLIPGVPARRTCDLLLTAQDVRVRADDAEAPLAWEAYTEAPHPTEPEGVGPNAMAGNCWRPAPWGTSRSGPVGVGLLVAGSCAAATESVRSRRRTWRSRFERLLSSGTAVPLYTPQTSLARAVSADLGTVGVLCRLLRDRVEWRRRLGDPERVRRLAADLVADRAGPVRPHSAVRRSTELTVHAMSALGLEHRLDGRPPPGETVPSTDELVPRVLDRIRSDPYASGANVDADDVRAVLEHFYTGVAPWPFAALAD